MVFSSLGRERPKVHTELTNLLGVHVAIWHQQIDVQ